MYLYSFKVDLQSSMYINVLARVYLWVFSNRAHGKRSTAREGIHVRQLCHCRSVHIACFVYIYAI